MTIINLSCAAIEMIQIRNSSAEKVRWLTSAIDHTILSNQLREQCAVQWHRKDLRESTTRVAILQRGDPDMPEVLQLIKAARAEVSSSGVTVYLLYNRKQKVGFKLNRQVETETELENSEPEKLFIFAK